MPKISDSEIAYEFFSGWLLQRGWWEGSRTWEVRECEEEFHFQEPGGEVMGRLSCRRATSADSGRGRGRAPGPGGRGLRAPRCEEGPNRTLPSFSSILFISIISVINVIKVICTLFECPVHTLYISIYLNSI